MFSLKDLNLYDSDKEFIDGTLELFQEALDFLEKHKWCKKIKNILFDRGFGKPLGVFYVEIEPSGLEVDDTVWVIVGDLPPAYMDIESCNNGAQALDAYVYCMNEWVEHVLAGKSVDGLIPVNVPPKIKYAKMLKSRLDFISEKIFTCLQG